MAGDNKTTPKALGDRHKPIKDFPGGLTAAQVRRIYSDIDRCPTDLMCDLRERFPEVYRHIVGMMRSLLA